MQTEAPAVQRVVIGFDPAPADAAALRVAAGLAAGLNAELVGLYVEDERLLRLAGLPFAQELGYPSVLYRRLDPGDMARSLRVQAERVRRLVAEAAAPLNLAWTLEVVRGELPRAALAATSIADLLVVAGSEAVALSRPPGRPADRAHLRPLVVLFEASVASLRALSLARLLQHTVGGELIVLVDPRAAEAFRALRIAQAAGERFLLLAGDEPRELQRTLRTLGPAAVIHPRDEGAATERLSGARLPCPLVLVG